jgi:tetratricopeptide (TPR) repeat protein
MRARNAAFFLLGLMLWAVGLGVAWAFQRLDRWLPDEGQRLRLAFAEARDEGRHAEALTLLDRLAEREGNGEWLAADRAEILLRLGRPAEAVEAWRLALASQGRNPWLLDSLAEAQRAAGDLDGAIQGLAEAIDRSEDRRSGERRFLAELLCRTACAGGAPCPRGMQPFRLVSSPTGQAACEPDEWLQGGGCGQAGWLLACPVSEGADWPTAPGDAHRRQGGTQDCPEGGAAFALCTPCPGCGAPLRSCEERASSACTPG